MHQHFLIGATGLLRELSGDCFRAVDTRAEHVEIFLR